MRELLTCIGHWTQRQHLNLSVHLPWLNSRANRDSQLMPANQKPSRCSEPRPKHHNSIIFSYGEEVNISLGPAKSGWTIRPSASWLIPWQPGGFRGEVRRTKKKVHVFVGAVERFLSHGDTTDKLSRSKPLRCLLRFYVLFCFVMQGASSQLLFDSSPACWLIVYFQRVEQPH